MAISNTGDQKIWFHGQPAQGGLTLASDTGTQKFWFHGQPFQYLNPQPPPPPASSARSYCIIVG